MFDKENPVRSMYKDQIITSFLMQRSSIFAELIKHQEEVWDNPQADEYFQYRQKRADAASPRAEKKFLKMMSEIAKEMDEKTQFLTDINTNKENGHRPPPPKVLDLCMAPGGFSDEVRDRLCPLAEIYGITLPASHGGHKLLLAQGARLEVKFLDITMLAAEMGATKTDIPLNHPDQNLFVFDRPFFGKMFDLILSDGQVLRTHKRQEYREKVEAVRLRYSQLIFALQHIKTGGTFVMLLHRAEMWPIFKQIYTFTQFSSKVQLFKPIKKHAIRSSFYLVAKGVQPQAPAALRAVEEWKEIWASATFRFSTWNQEDPPEDEVNSALEVFGETFIEICEPLWAIQLAALHREIETGFSISS